MSGQMYYEPYSPMAQVDYTAGVTEMMGSESQTNIEASASARLRESPTKSLVALWVFALLLYFILSFTFRRYLA